MNIQLHCHEKAGIIQVRVYVKAACIGVGLERYQFAVASFGKGLAREGGVVPAMTAAKLAV